MFSLHSDNSLFCHLAWKRENQHLSSGEKKAFMLSHAYFKIDMPLIALLSITT